MEEGSKATYWLLMDYLCSPQNHLIYKHESLPLSRGKNIEKEKRVNTQNH